MRAEVKEIVFNFFAEECEVDRGTRNDDTRIIEDFEGDCLMFLDPAREFTGNGGE